jgi:hypothetical protein
MRWMIWLALSDRPYLLLPPYSATRRRCTRPSSASWALLGVPRA